MNIGGKALTRLGSTRPVFRRRARRSWLLLAAIAAVVAVRLLRPERESGETPSADQVLAEGDYRVVRVIDGDTLLLASEAKATERGAASFRLRLLGIDCPETVKPDQPVEPWGPEASEFTREYLQAGRARLRFDNRRVDQYGRHLGYVFVGERMLNEELVRAGLARVSIYPGDSEAIGGRLRKAQQEARIAGRGLWSAAPVGESNKN